MLCRLLVPVVVVVVVALTDIAMRVLRVLPRNPNAPVDAQEAALVPMLLRVTLFGGLTLAPIGVVVAAGVAVRSLMRQQLLRVTELQVKNQNKVAVPNVEHVHDSKLRAHSNSTQIPPKFRQGCASKKIPAAPQEPGGTRSSRSARSPKYAKNAARANLHLKSSSSAQAPKFEVAPGLLAALPLNEPNGSSSSS